MQVLHERFADDPSITVIAVHVDNSGDPLAYLAEHDYTFPVILEGGAVANRYNISTLPTLLVIDPRGIVVHKYRGVLNDIVRDEIVRVALEARVDASGSRESSTSGY